MQFRRGMKEMVKEFPEELVDVLVARYGYQTSSRVKDVNYDALQKDIDKYGNQDLPEFPWTQKLYHEPYIYIFIFILIFALIFLIIFLNFSLVLFIYLL